MEWIVFLILALIAVAGIFYDRRQKQTLDEMIVKNEGLLDRVEKLNFERRVRFPDGEMSESDLTVALAVPDSHPLLRAILQVMDGQREELLQDAAEQGIDPAESMARSRGADALRESADEIWQLVKQANAERVEDPIAAGAGESG